MDAATATRPLAGGHDDSVCLGTTGPPRRPAESAPAHGGPAPSGLRTAEGTARTAEGTAGDLRYDVAQFSPHGPSRTTPLHFLSTRRMGDSAPPPDPKRDAQDDNRLERAKSVGGEVGETLSSVSSKRKNNFSPRDAPKRVAHNRAERQRTLRLRTALQRLREAAGCQEVDRASVIAAAAARLEEFQSQKQGPGNSQHGQESERLALLDKLDLGICVLDAAGIIVGANQSFANFMCCSFQEVRMQRCLVVQPLLMLVPAAATTAINIYAGEHRFRS